MKLERRKLLTGVLVAVGVCSLALAVGANRQGAQELRTEEVRAKQARAYRQRGLAAAAELTGLYVTSYTFGAVADPASFEELLALGDAVLIGTPVRNRSELGAGGKTIFTRFFVAVEQVLDVADGVQVGDFVEVVVPGGKMTFPGGHTAEVRPHGYRLPDPSSRGLWILRNTSLGPQERVRPATDGTDPFVLAGGPLGYFDFTPDNDRGIHASGNGTGLFARRLPKHLDEEAFLALVRAAIRD